MLLAALNWITAPRRPLPFETSEAGQDMAEYALLLGLLTLGTIAVIVLVGPSVKDTFQYIVDELKTA